MTILYIYLRNSAILQWPLRTLEHHKYTGAHAAGQVCAQFL